MYVSLKYNIEYTCNGHVLSIYSNHCLHESPVSLLSGLLWIINLVPGGAKGTRLKLWLPKKYVRADNMGLTLELRSMLIVNSAWGKSLSHSLVWNYGSHLVSPASRWFLNVLFTCSTVLRLCWPGGASWNLTPFFIIISFKFAKHSLSII